MKAILFGSIGTLVETSEIQRKSYNLAFEKVGVEWYWNTATYCNLLSGLSDFLFLNTSHSCACLGLDVSNKRN